MTEQPGAKRQPGSPPIGLAASAAAAQRWQEFTAYVGQYDHDREQAAALLQLAVELSDQGRGKASLRLEWRNVYAAVATLTRTDSETLHARLTVGFSPAEFKWMLQNKAVYTWHSQPVRFQRCLQCMVAKLGQCGSSAEKTCWSCRSRLTDAPVGQVASQGNSLRPPRHIALSMAKTAAKQPVGAHEVDAHISMYEQSKWPLTKRDQTYLSQANKFWVFISSPNYLGITDKSQLLELTHRACTKRYILYMHKMNKRENVRAAVDLACLGLSSADPSQSGSAAHSAHSAPELPAATGRSAGAHAQLDRPATSLASVAHTPAAEPGSTAAAVATAERQEEALSELETRSSHTEPLRRSSRGILSQPLLAEPPSATQAAAEPQGALAASVGVQNDWVNPSNELLAVLRQELDLELRDAPDDSDGSGRAESGLAKKCKPWHWLQEMRQYGYERQVMPKDQKKRRKRTFAQDAAAPSSSAPASTQAATQAQPVRRQQLRRKAAKQVSFDTDSSDLESPVEAEEENEEGESPPAGFSRRQRTQRGSRLSVPAEAAAVSIPTKARNVESSTEGLQNTQLEGWGQADAAPRASQSLAQQAQEDLLLGLGPLASFGAGLGGPAALPSSSTVSQPITGVLTFPEFDQSAALRSTQLDIPSLAWSLPGFESSAGLSQQPSSLSSQGQAPSRPSYQINIDLPPLLDSSQVSMSSDARLQQRYAAPVQRIDNLFSSTFPAYSQPRPSWHFPPSEQQQQHPHQHQLQAYASGVAGHAHGLQQSALHGLQMGGADAEQQMQGNVHSSQLQVFDYLGQRLCQGYASQHALLQTQPSSLDLFSGYAAQQQQQQQHHQLQHQVPSDRSDTGQWAAAMLQHQQHQQSQQAGRDFAQASMLEASLAQEERRSTLQPSRSDLLSSQPPRSLSIAQRYGGQQVDTMPSDDLDTAYRQAMQGQLDPWGGPVLQLPPAVPTPNPARMGPFAGSQNPRPSFGTLSQGSLHASSQLSRDVFPSSGTSQSLPDMPSRARANPRNQSPSSSQPPSD